MTNEEWAEAILAAYRKGARAGRYVWTYGDLASATGREGQYRLMGPALDLVRERCLLAGIPDCASMVVAKEELLSGSIRPSEKALEKHGGWPGLRKQQADCLTYNW